MSEVLQSWNDTGTKQAILDFVAAVTDEAGPGYVPPAERVATFDNDGTLWCEKPAYIQLFSPLRVSSRWPKPILIYSHSRLTKPPSREIWPTLPACTPRTSLP